MANLRSSKAKKCLEVREAKRKARIALMYPPKKAKDVKVKS
jgi:hypothetical protein